MSTPQTPSVVLVEDSVPYARLVAMLLADAFPGGIEVRVHDTIAAAIEDLHASDADCVLLDLGLPDAKGLEGLARLHAAGVEASVVVLSAREDEELALAAIKAGAQDYLRKGDEQETETFVRAIRHAIERRRAQRRSEELLRAKEDRWRTLTHLAPVGMVELDGDGLCVFANTRFLEITGRALDDVLGRDWLDAVHVDDRAAVRAAWQEAAADSGDLSTEGRIVRPDDSVVWTVVNATAIEDPWGGVAGWLGTLVDVSEARRAREDLRKAEERFRLAFRGAPIGMTLTGPDGAYLEVNPAFCALVGLNESEILGRPFSALTHPDDREPSAQRWEQVLAEGAPSGQWEKRYLHADGHAVWTRITISPTRDADGRLISAIAQIEDITQRRAAEQELQRQQLDMLAVAALARDAGVAEDPYTPLCVGARRLLGATAAVLAVHDGAGRLVMAASDGLDPSIDVSVRVEERTGQTACFLARERIEIPDALASSAVSADLSRATGYRGLVFEPVLRQDEVLGVLTLAWEGVRDPLSTREATLVRLLAAEMAAAIERRRLLDQLRDLARTDPLTGLPNRRMWDDRVPSELARAGRISTPMCAAMLDLDRFKDYNDRNGHQAGDRLLRETTARWQAVLRPSDLLARLGGDEFALLLPDADREAALQIVERLQATMSPEIGCSAGIVRWTPGEDGGAFLARADEALYAAKEAGGGRIVMR